MADADAVIARMFAGRGVLTREELYRAAVAADASVEFVTDVYLLPDNLYTPGEVLRAVGREG